MFIKIKRILSASAWKLVAIVLIVIVAGPELLLGMELMVLLEALGASTFVIAFVCGARVQLELFCDSIKRLRSRVKKLASSVIP